MAEVKSEPLALDCDVECPAEVLAKGLRAKVTAKMYEGDSEAPTNIVKAGSPCWLDVRIDFTGCELARLLCLKWCVRVCLEVCGPGEDKELYKNTIDQQVCRQTYVEIDEIPVRFSDVDKCGTMYDLCITVTAQDACGRPAPFGGYCHGEHIMVYPAS